MAKKKSQKDHSVPATPNASETGGKKNSKAGKTTRLSDMTWQEREAADWKERWSPSGPPFGLSKEEIRKQHLEGPEPRAGDAQTRAGNLNSTVRGIGVEPPRLRS
jgi:hypothetical protein